MHKKNPDPDGFRAWIQHKAATAARNSCTIGDLSEDGRVILRKEGWTLRPTPSGAGRRWHPPEEEGEGRKPLPKEVLAAKGFRGGSLPPLLHHPAADSPGVPHCPLFITDDVRAGKRGPSKH